MHVNAWPYPFMYSDGRLHPGDELLMVDGKTLVGLTHDEAVAVLKATQKLVQLVVATEHADGESVSSSLQSIPEKLNMFSSAGVVERPEVESSHSFTVTASEPAVVAPNLFQSPQRNAFQQEGVEMKHMTEEFLSHIHRQVSAEQMETKFEDTEDDERLRVIKITRSEGQLLGFSICQSHNHGLGGSRIAVRAINPNGVVGKDKQLHERDLLINVNGISLEGLTQPEALQVLTVRIILGLF